MFVCNRIPEKLLYLCTDGYRTFFNIAPECCLRDVSLSVAGILHRGSVARIRAVEEVPGVEKAKASASANTLTIKGPAAEDAVRAAVEGIGYTFKGKA